MRVVYSCLFWGFLTLSSILLFPVAVLIWALTAAVDARKVVLHAFTSLWANLYTWLNPAWPVTVVVVEAGYSKRGRREEIRLRSDLARQLDRHIATRMPQTPAFDLPAATSMARMLRRDAEEVGIQGGVGVADKDKTE